MPQYVLKATAENGRVALSAASGVQLTATIRRQVIKSVNSITRLMALTVISRQARRQENPAMVSVVDTVRALVHRSV